jgi:hypothetical protein
LHLPDFPPISDETLDAIGERYDLRAGEISPSKEAGIPLRAISRPVTRNLCDFGQVCQHHNLPQCLFQSLCSHLTDVRYEPLHLDPSAGWC